MIDLNSEGRTSAVEAVSRPQTAPSAADRLAQNSPASHLYHVRDQRREQRDTHGHDMSSADETSSVLDAESVFLPVPSELSLSPTKPFNLDFLMSQRPSTAPPRAAERHSVDLGSEDSSMCGPAVPHRVLAPSGASNRRSQPTDDKPNTKVRSRLAANFSQPPPRTNQNSGIPTPNVPALHSNSSRPHTPHGSHSHSELPEESELDGISTDSSQASLELKLLKAIMDKRKSSSKSSKKTRRSKDLASNGGDEAVAPLQLIPQQYSPQKYRDNMWRYHMNNRHEGAAGEVLDGQIQLSGVGAAAGKVRLDDDKVRNMAATKLQAVWRGVSVRQKDEAGVRARKEIRTRRSEEYILQLQAEVQRQKQLYEQEKELRSKQVDTMKLLWREVQDLQRWKKEVIISQDQYKRPVLNASSRSSVQDSQIRIENIPNIIETLEKGSGVSENESGGSVSRPINLPIPSTLSPHPTTVLPSGVHFSDLHGTEVSISSQIRASHKELELENACKSLQKQVSQLKDMLTSVSHAVFQGAAVSVDKDIDTTGLEAIRLSMNFESSPEYQTSPGGSRGSVSLLAPPTSHPPPGVPCPPGNLCAHPYSSTSVILCWQPSVILSHQGTTVTKNLVGYRVYVNASPRGFSSGYSAKVLLEGLSPMAVYRVTVRAVSSLGESTDSNMVIISPESEEDVRPYTEQSPNRDGDTEDQEPPNNPPGSRNRSPRDPDGRGADKPDSPGGPRHSPGGSTGGEGSGSHQTKVSSSSTRDSSPRLPKYLLNRESQGPGDDSGYLTPSSVQRKSNATSIKERIAEEMKNFTDIDRRSSFKKTSACERLDMNQKEPPSGQDEAKVTSFSSIKIHEGLIRKLDGSKELKQAVKTQKRKPSPDHGAPLKAIPSDPDLLERENSGHASDTCEEGKFKLLSRIPVFSGRDDSGFKAQRKSSFPDSSSEGSRSRRSSTSEPRSRRSSGNEEGRSRLGSGSDSKDPYSIHKILTEAQAAIIAGLGKTPNAPAPIKIKSNTIGSESPATSPPIVAESVPDRHTWPKNMSEGNKVVLNEKLYIDDSPSNTDATPMPRPPEEVSPRRNSLGRRPSLRSRHRSGSDSSRDADKESSESSDPKQKASRVPGSPSSHRTSGSESDALLHDPSSSPEQQKKQYFQRRTRGRGSVKEPRRTKEVQPEKRASSVGPVLRGSPGSGSPSGFLRDKPPPVPGTRPLEVIQPPVIMPASGSSRRRTKSEQSTASSDGEGLVADPTGSKGKKDGGKSSSKEKKRKSEMKISHRRSASDATGVPRLQIPEPDSPRGKNSTPSTPMQCPSSPRVRRSSSFSKAASGDSPRDKGEALLRQCISLETLKAAKSPNAKAKLLEHFKQKADAARAGSSGNGEQSSSGDEQPDVGSARASPSAPVLSGADRDSSGLRRSTSLKDTQDLLKKTEEEQSAQFYLGVSAGLDQASGGTDKPESYSPRIQKREDSSSSSRHRKIKIGTKAADLFSKLQLKLSTNK